MSGTLTKLNLAAYTASEKRFEKISRQKMTDIIETFLDEIICHFQSGGTRVTLRGFGTFKLRRRGAFTGSNPNTGESIKIPERLSVTFKPGAEVLRRLNLK
jgi:nucleoid DNA-binding protein